MQPKRERTHSAGWIFFKRWLSNPLSIGSITPSGEALGRVIAHQVIRAPEEHVVELGGGTGSVIKAMIGSGIPAERICSIEIELELVAFLRQTYPSIRVIEGDARVCDRLLRDELIGKIGTIIVGIPMILLPLEQQQQIIDAIFRAAPNGQRFLLYSYWIASPLPARKLGLRARRVGFTWLNFPPVSLWEYTKI